MYPIPVLFNLCGETIVRIVDTNLNDRTGCIFGGRALWNIRYADDTTLIAQSRQELITLASEVLKASRKLDCTSSQSRHILCLMLIASL